MAAACPICADPSQVLALPAFWRSLPREAELRRELAQPPEYEPALLPVVGLLVFGGWAVWSGAWVVGVLAAVAGLAAGVWVWRLWLEAERAREEWERSLYCRRCPRVFLREHAKLV